MKMCCPICWMSSTFFQSVEMDELLGQGTVSLLHICIAPHTVKCSLHLGLIAAARKAATRLEACMEPAPRLLLKVLPTEGKYNNKTGRREGRQVGSLLCTKYFAFALATTNK